MSRLGPLRLSVILWALLATCWALVSPLGSVPDEPAHVIYAAAVVRGQFDGRESAGVFDVPGAVARSAALTCTAFEPSTTADCTPRLGSLPGPDPMRVLTPGAGYPPLYYALVGWPTLLPFGPAAWYAMRLTSVLLGAALLWFAAGAWTREPPLVTAGLLVAGTPMVGFVLGSVNPNGVEIVAGVAMVLAGTGLLDALRGGGRPSARAVLPLLASTGYLALARPSSYLPAAALMAVLVLAGARELRACPRLALGLLAGAAGALVSGVLAARLARSPGGPLAPNVGRQWGDSARQTVDLVATWARETVGIFGWRDHEVPLVFSLGWLLLSLTLVITALVIGDGWQRTAVLASVGGAYVAGPFFTVLTVFGGGPGYQGRYAMALTQAVPVLAGAVAAAGGARLPAPLARVLPPALLVLSASALAGSALRYAVGLPLPGPAGTVGSVVWLPPAWPLVLLLLAAAGAVSVLLARALTEAPARTPVAASAR